MLISYEGTQQISMLFMAVIISCYLPEKQCNVNQCAVTPNCKSDTVWLKHFLMFTHSSKTYIHLHVTTKIALPCVIKDLFQDVIKTIKRIMETVISQTFVHCAVRELDLIMIRRMLLSLSMCWIRNQAKPRLSVKNFQDI